MAGRPRACEWLHVLSILLVVSTFGCGKSDLSKQPPEQSAKGQAPPAENTPDQQQSEDSSPRTLSKPGQPLTMEVEEKVKHIYQDSVVLDATQNPYFITGDFNDHLSPDIAMVVKPAAGSSRISMMSSRTELLRIR